MNYITKQHNYDNGYIGLVDLKIEDLPETILIGDERFFRKSEFHISLICAKRIAPLIDSVHVEEIEKKIVEDFIDYVKKSPMEHFKPKKEFFLVSKDIRKSIVGLYDMPELSNYFEHLKKKFGKKIPTQLAHITLYTLQPEAAIGILSHDELNRIGERVEIEEFENVKWSN